MPSRHISYFLVTKRNKRNNQFKCVSYNCPIVVRNILKWTSETLKTLLFRGVESTMS